MKKPLADDLRKRIMAETLSDPMLFFRTFLPHWFSKPLSWAHRGLVAILLRNPDFLLNFGVEKWPEGEYEWTPQDLKKILKFFVWKERPEDPTCSEYPLFELDLSGEAPRLHLSIRPFTQVVWPRGFGKTTTINAVNIMKVVFQLRKFIVYLSETATHANQQINNIKRELETNEALIQVSGIQKPERNAPQAWREDFFETVGGVALTGRGRGGQVRGLLHGTARPDDITVDDVEDKESVSTEEQRKKTMTWFKADVEPALNQIRGDGVINLIGTILHREALIPQIMGDPDWISVVFGALDPEGQPLWPEYMGIEQLQAKKMSFARVGMLAEFYMEFLSKIVNTDASKFKPPFKYQIMKRTEFVGVAEACDPAIADKKKSDFFAIAVTGITERGHHHVLDMHVERGVHPSRQVDLFFEYHFKWNPTHHGIEAIAYQRALIHMVREEMFRKAKKMGGSAYFEITPILHGMTGKIARVEGILAPRYAAGYITHQRVFPELEQQLLDWPNDKRDAPDVVAMAISLLDPYAATAFDPTITTDEGEIVVADALARDMYEPLDDFRNAP